MIYHPINAYVQYPELLAEKVKLVIGANRLFGIEENIDGQFFLLADDVTLSEKDVIDAIVYPVKKKLKINNLTVSYVDPYQDAFNVDFITGLNVKLHRKSILIKGELQREEYYLNYISGVYSELIVKEETTYTRDANGFPVYKDVLVSWVCEDGTFHEKTKSWRKWYSYLERIQEGKTRRGNLVSNLQVPILGFISMSMTGTQYPNNDVVVEARRFLAEYNDLFNLFTDSSTKTIIDCLNNSSNPRYITSSNYSWIDWTTPYNITIRQFIISEMTI
jgi:hypothetical protein